MPSIDFYKYPGQIKLSEEYTCHIVLSDSQTKKWNEESPPGGKLEINIPYDVWMKLRKDYQKEKGSIKDMLSTAKTQLQEKWGELVHEDMELRNPRIQHYERTNIDAVLDIHKYKDALPVEKIFAQVLENWHPDDNDTRERKLGFEYQPDNPGQVPIDIELSFYDEYDPSAQGSPFNPRDYRDVDQKVSGQVQKYSLLNYLVLKFNISLKIKNFKGNNPKPEIKKFLLQWPVTLSSPFMKYSCRCEVKEKEDVNSGKVERTVMKCKDGSGVFEPNSPIVESTRIRIEDDKEENSKEIDEEKKHIKVILLQEGVYKPNKKGIVWSKVPCTKCESNDKDERTYSWELYVITSNYPHEFYHLLEAEKIKLHGEIEFNITDCLYSGSYVDKHKKFMPELKQESKIVCDLEMDVNELFRSKMYYPFQYFYFENLVFDDLRKADIVALLKEQGFWILADRKDGKRDKIVAQSYKNLRMIHLLFDIEGEDYQTRRKKKIPGHEVYTTLLPAGYTKIFTQGHVKEDFYIVVGELAKLHGELKERFKHVNTVE